MMGGGGPGIPPEYYQGRDYIYLAATQIQMDIYVMEMVIYVSLVWI